MTGKEATDFGGRVTEKQIRISLNSHIDAESVELHGDSLIFLEGAYRDSLW